MVVDGWLGRPTRPLDQPNGTREDSPDAPSIVVGGRGLHRWVEGLCMQPDALSIVVGEPLLFYYCRAYRE